MQSDRWKTLPGNYDKLNAARLYASSGPWGIPSLAPDDGENLPEHLHCYDEWRAKRPRPAGDGVHFFTDDYRFEPCWNQPDNARQVLNGASLVLSPDFSLYRDWPLALQLYNTYRNRWLGAHWQSAGLRVIPTVSWSVEASYAFCFDGLPSQSTLAVSTVGIKEPEARRLFRDGYCAMVDRLNPIRVIVYGEVLPSELEALAPIRRYDVAWIRSLRKRADPEPRSQRHDDLQEEQRNP